MGHSYLIEAALADQRRRDKERRDFDALKGPKKKCASTMCLSMIPINSNHNHCRSCLADLFPERTSPSRRW